jgi:hypothetical protein
LRELVSERIERIERGAMIEKYFYEEFGMESLKFKGTNEEFKGENYVYLLIKFQRFISETFPQQEISLYHKKMR